MFRRLEEFCLDEPVLGWILVVILSIACIVLYNQRYSDITIVNHYNHPIEFTSIANPIETPPIIIAPGDSITRHIDRMVFWPPGHKFEFE
ncbi:hypothetical protein K8R42_00675 [bacterium]|nr:hypothetical protein [bacterium]